MGKTLLCIDTYSKISPFLKLAWPYYERAGFDILGIQRTNAPTEWPKPVRVLASGEDAFMSYADLRHTNRKNLLVERWIDIMLHFAKSPDYREYDNFCMIEWDLLPLKPFPKFCETIGLCLNKVGDRPMDRLLPGARSPTLFHMPWWVDRDRAWMICQKGMDLLSKGDTEGGNFDWLLGVIVLELKLPWQPFDGFSLNKLDSAPAIQQAREAIARGTYSVHGCQTEQQFQALFAP